MKNRGATVTLSDVRQNWTVTVSFRRRRRSWIQRFLEWLLGRDI